MPTLNWIGKQAVVKHHKEVPFRLLEPVAELSCAGRDAVLAALSEPARQIAINAGEDGGAMLARVIEAGGVFGFNARSCRVTDLEADGVLDATNVVRCALKNAASIAGLVLSTSTLVARPTCTSPP